MSTFYFLLIRILIFQSNKYKSDFILEFPGFFDRNYLYKSVVFQMFCQTRYVSISYSTKISPAPESSSIPSCEGKSLHLKQVRNLGLFTYKISREKTWTRTGIRTIYLYIHVTRMIKILLFSM